jgi:hypothetical protein
VCADTVLCAGNTASVVSCPSRAGEFATTGTPWRICLAALSRAESAKKWMASTRTERAAPRSIIYLYRVLGDPTSNEADPTGHSYAFERVCWED